jgi:hypothetical protein
MYKSIFILFIASIALITIDLKSNTALFSFIVFLSGPFIIVYLNKKYFKNNDTYKNKSNYYKYISWIVGLLITIMGFSSCEFGHSIDKKIDAKLEIVGALLLKQKSITGIYPKDLLEISSALAKDSDITSVSETRLKVHDKSVRYSPSIPGFEYICFGSMDYCTYNIETNKRRVEVCNNILYI